MHDALAPCAAWALTFAVHAGVFFLVASLVDRALLRRVDDAVREVVWRLALLGGLATATAQLGFGIVPVTGAWSAEFGDPTRATTMALSATDAQDAALSALEVPATFGAFAWMDPAMLGCAILFWAAGAGLALPHLFLAYTGLRRRLQPRHPAPALAAELRQIAARLGMRATPRVTTSARAPTPLALGVLHSEVCVPERALRELAPDELRAMLAHELAHVQRRDPTWTLVYAIVCRALFWHPALWFARRRLLALAEMRCDAIARTVEPQAELALARALVRAAEWLVPAGRGVRVAHGHAMAAVCNGLQHRIRLLLAKPISGTRAGARWAPAVALTLAAGAPFLLPAVVDRELPSVASAAGSALPGSGLSPLPVPLHQLVQDVELLRAEIASVRDLAEQARLTDDAAVAALLVEIDRRVQSLARRCRNLVDRFRNDPETTPFDLR